jgi:RNA polymerase sigma factor (sigma-70 family)
MIRAGMATVLAPPRADRAFERLYRRHVTDVYRYVLAVLQNEADAEDATQTTFLSAYRAFERGQRPERPQNWLIAIAHNVCRQRFRESARRPRLVELEDDVAAREVDIGTPNAEDIRRALGYLAFNQRAALVMRELQGRSYGEIADILGVSNGAVETLLFRARRAMREQLEGGLSCGDAELALSKRVDGELSFGERGALRAHLRECPECAALERRLRFRGRALKQIALVPLPQSLGSLFGGGAAGTGAAVGTKAAAVVVAGVFGTGLAGDAIEQTKGAREDRSVAATAPRPVLWSGAGVVSARASAGPAQAGGFESAGVLQHSTASSLVRPSASTPMPAARTGARADASPSSASSARPGAAAGLADESSQPHDTGTTASPSTEPGRPEETPRGSPVRRPVSKPAHPVPKRGEHPRAVEFPRIRDLPKPPKLPKPVDLPKRSQLPGRPELPNLPEVSRAADVPKPPEVPKPPDVPKLPELPKPPNPPQLPGPLEPPKPPQLPNPPELPKPPDVPTLP